MSEQEAVWFTLDWKVPCVLFYSSTEAIAHDGKDITIESITFNPFAHVSLEKQKRSVRFFSYDFIPLQHRTFSVSKFAKISN